jgi:hypothetical protein
VHKSSGTPHCRFGRHIWIINGPVVNPEDIRDIIQQLFAEAAVGEEKTI